MGKTKQPKVKQTSQNKKLSKEMIHEAQAINKRFLL